MWRVVETWVNRYFADEEAVLLLLLLLAGLVLVITMGGIAAPIIAALGFAFLLQGAVNFLKRWRVPHLLAVVVVFTAFIGLFVLVLIFLVPMVIHQSSNLLAEIPGMLKRGQEVLQLLPERYPHLISEERLVEFTTYANAEARKFVEAALTFSVSQFPNLIGLLVYLILVPLMVFFILKDRQQLITMFANLLPERRPVMRAVWSEMNAQIANYIRGKAVEILIVGVVSYFCFLALGLRYSALLALAVGLSVLIPYIGAAVVTVPILVVGYFQWGWGNEFIWLAVIYGVIQFLDGNVLVPLLFSEAVNLHPLSIILAVLVFGGIWGFWGVFFAIPLATLIKALYNAWPQHEKTV